MTYPLNNIEQDKNSNHFLYVMICIDVVSKYVFYSFLERKLRDNVKLAISIILKNIRKEKKKSLFYNVNKSLTFFADYGQEFLFEDVKLYCKEKGAILLDNGMPGVKKLGIVDRLIRSLQKMFSVTINDIVSKRSLKREIK